MNDVATCPSCRQALRVPPSLVGQRLKCPACAIDFDPAPAPPPLGPPRSRRHRDDDEDDRRPAYRSDDAKPAKVQTLGILMLVGGIVSCLVGGVWVFTCFGLFLWTPLAIVTGVLCIIKASALLGPPPTRHDLSPLIPAILQVVCIINLDVLNLALGIVELVLLNDPEVRRYLRL